MAILLCAAMTFSVLPSAAAKAEDDFYGLCLLQ